MPVRILLALLMVAPAAWAQTSLVYLPFGQLHSSSGCCVAEDAAGNTYVAASVPGILSVTKTDRNLNQVYGYGLDANGITPAGIAVDVQGNVFVVGEASSNLPLVHPIPGSAPAVRNGFVIKLNAAGDQLLFSSYFASEIYALALDPAGNVYVTGYESQPCQATAGAYQAPSFAAQNYCGVVAEISNSGSLIYAALLPNAPSAIAVSPNGSATVAGGTSYAGYPVTPGTFQSTCGCQSHSNAYNGYVSRLSPDGSSLQWSTFFGGSGVDMLTSVAVAPDGGVIVAGQSSSPDFPVTPGAFQSAPHAPLPGIAVAKLNSLGTRLVFSSRFGTSGFGVLKVQLDAQSHIWINGQASPPDFPTLPGSLILGNRQYIAEMAADGSALLLTQFPPNYAADAIALDPAGYVILAGEKGSLLRFPIGGPSGTAILGEGNAIPGTEAGYTVSGIVSPGGIVTFYGVGLGPTAGMGAQFDSTGKIATSLAGTQVLFAGVPAPLLYVSANQINVIVPFGVSAFSLGTVPIEVRTAQGAAREVVLYAAAADPGILAVPDTETGGYRSLVINQDGSINSSSNPAAQGSIVTFWADGTGLFQTPLEDGAIIQPPLPTPALPISISILVGPFGAVLPCNVLYAGAAPGMVAGILQVNVRLPVGVRFGSPYNAIEFQVGGFGYQGAVAIQQ